jgi:hypothetical protein
MTMIIRLESDWGLPPFYIDKGDGRLEGCSADNLARIFGLPDRVMAALRDWDRIYQDLLDWDDPRGSGWANADDEQRYLERGRAAARLLRQHVPDDVRIEYCGTGSVPLECY